MTAVAEVAQWLTALAGLWLIAVGACMFAVPRHALVALAAMGSSNPIHFGEMAVRGAVGVLFILAGPVARFPAETALIRWFLLASAVVLALLPRRWHAGYSRWWAEAISPLSVRFVAPLSIAGGGALIWSLFPEIAWWGRTSELD